MRLIDVDALRDEVLYDSTYDNDTVNYYLGLIDEAPQVDVLAEYREWLRRAIQSTCDLSRAATNTREKERLRSKCEGLQMAMKHFDDLIKDAGGQP